MYQRLSPYHSPPATGSVLSTEGGNPTESHLEGLLSRIMLSTICHSPGFQKTACVRAHLLSLTLVTPRTIACQASLSMGFLRQKYWSGLPFPSPGDCRNLRIEPVSPALAGGFFTTESPGKSSRKQSLRHKFI